MANYQDFDIPEYSNNPLIDALPKFISKKELLSKTLSPPDFSSDERNHDELKRDIYTERLDDSIIPNNKFFKAYKKIFKLLLKSYKYRSPLNTDTKTLLNHIASKGKNAPYPQTLLNKNAHSFFLTGLSGMGKSYMIDNILSIAFEQVITHSIYNGEKLNFKQLVYVKFNCPSDASRRVICLNFFRAVDDAIGTNYANENKNKNIPIPDLELNMKKICLIHHIGLIVIDELQNLSMAKAGGAKAAMTFFESFSNEINVSFLFIGTYDSYDIYSRSFKTARRMAKDGTIDLEQPIETDPVWNQLVDVLWNYQWVKKLIPMNTDIKKLLYKLTQGITFCTVSLLKCANVYAIENDEESITEQTIYDAYKEEFKLLMPSLDALRDKNYAAFDDLMPLAIRRMLQRKKQRNSDDNLESPISNDDITSTTESIATSKSQINKFQRKKRLKETTQDVYDRLKSSGFFITDLNSI
ncbi:hypothetical protein ACH42_09390 [Endozoicomonas sp. (ex Bugula neritina AB1)]|nr:hypothetical protein ACH42_09390 [Endozoicomonas sp. (ex Bugula neritina AB1)]